MIVQPGIVSRRVFASASALVVLALATSAALAADPQYTAHGVVKSFGPKHAYVNIAHEKIPGYMEAMTMSFEPRRPEQLDGLDVGAKVSFTFTATGDGHRVLDAIAKE
jgi:Cu/Ag efflux protein CusF